MASSRLPGGESFSSAIRGSGRGWALRLSMGMGMIPLTDRCGPEDADEPPAPPPSWASAASFGRLRMPARSSADSALMDRDSGCSGGFVLRPLSREDAFDSGEREVTVEPAAELAATLTLGAGLLQRGEMEGAPDLLLFSALRGCSRSGDSARRSSGLPGSALLGRANPFLPQPPAAGPGVDRDEPGLYDCVVLELPGWCTAGKASGDGEGERVGDDGRGDGDGVRASGDSGMWPTDFRRPDGEWMLLAALCSLCLRPCSVDGRW